MNLGELQKEINEIDRQLVELFSNAWLSRRGLPNTSECGMPVQDADRERSCLR